MWFKKQLPEAAGVKKSSAKAASSAGNSFHSHSPNVI
jgi:hypothetical protein